jgi:Caspase domain
MREMRKQLVPACFMALTLTWVPPAQAAGEACSQARAIVAEAKGLYAGRAPDHAAVLAKLKVARNLCPTLGEAWKYSYCSASALNQAQDARIFRDRALFAGVTELSCPASGAGPAAVPSGPLPGYVRAKYALVVGIGTFKDPGIPHLQYAAKDARDLAAVLVDPRYGRFAPANVALLTDDKATRSNILNALQDLFLKAQEDDMVFVYVSSHGSPRRSELGLNGVGYIVTYDTALRNIYVDALDYEGFSRQVSTLKARRKAVFLDTCFSGQAFRKGEKALSIEGGGIDETTARLFLSGEGTYVVTSSKADERSFESDSLANSYFTHYLMAALRRSGEPPTLKELFSLLAHEVPLAVSHDKGMPQHPQLVPADGPGDLRIGVMPRPESSTKQKGDLR